MDWRALWLLLGGVLVACGHQDGIVGTRLLGQAGQDATGAAGQSTRGFTEEFAQNADIWDEQATLLGASTSFGLDSPTARDGYLAELRFPGHPEYAATDRVSAKYVTQLVTRERFHFGTYRTRLAFGSCAPSEEAVMSFLGYFNDNQDHDGDGIVDDLEISVQVTCGAPSRVYVTVFTDDEATAQGTRFRKLSHLIDFATGEEFETPASDSDQFASIGTDPTLVAPDLFAADALYELGFEWHTDSIRFFLMQNGVERSLWTLSGTERVPQLPAYIMYNIWHPAEHWYPRANAADFPANDVVMHVDWVTFEPE